MNMNIINDWLINKNKLLFITGNPCSGKTKLLNEIIKDYEFIEIESINKFTLDNIKYIFNTNNIEAMVMNHNKKKIVYIEDNTNINIKFFKSLVKLNKNIIITMTEPIASKFMNFIKTQFHIQLNKSYNNNSNNDTYYYNVFDIINKLLNKNISIKDTNIIYDDIIILYHLIDYTNDMDTLIDLYNCFYYYNSNIYNETYYKLFYLILPILIIRNKNIYQKINKYTNNISKLILSKKKENIYNYNKNSYNDYINLIQSI